MRKQGLILIPFLLTIGCNTEEIPDSPIANDDTKNMAKSIEFQSEQWVRRYDSENEVIAMAITPMVDDFSVVMLTEKKPDGSTFNKSLYAEKNLTHKFDDDGDDVFGEAWNVGYLDENVMKVMAKKYGFEQEVEAVAKENVGTAASVNPQFANSWLNNYMLWHMLYNRPMTIERGYRGSSFIARPRGFRPYAAAAPLNKMNLGPKVWAIPSATKGVSSSVLSGKGSSISSGRAASVSRGGFGSGAGARGMSTGG